MNYSKFNNIYLSILSENVENSKDELNQDNDEKSKQFDASNIDDLTKENITTIEEENEEENDKLDDLNQDQQDQDDSDSEKETNFDSASKNDGWDEDVEELCNELTYKFDGFAYEIKNCVKGSFTNASNTSELADYLENLNKEIDDVITQLREM